MDKWLVDKVLIGEMGIAEKQGTFAHSYICQVCGLHFVVYSWKLEREEDGCPECGYMFTYHQVKKINGEIFEYCPVKGSNTVADSVTRMNLKRCIISAGGR
ncbi:hypothetical protein [Pelosinus sp. UFO1]|uniref:hypothetical protein n=1 Tax=Pelosinus sp. UFO1 TaxID=484770 RepID=UPI0004D10C3A|nr:hypothetical protein [Pelosinus sp. UFO1]AIF51984.1 hypothetical protein UFO1_2437 [Pelosinus sp. UFO1]